MASQYLLIPLLLLPLLLLLKIISTVKSKHKLPPGPWTLPIIGSIHHLAGRGLPHHAFRSLSQQYGHLMFLQLGELQVVIVSSKEAATEVLKTHDLNFCTRPVNPSTEIVSYNAKSIAFAPYGEYWREIRKICSIELLSTTRVQSFRSIREEEVKSMMQQIQLLSSTGQFLNLSERLSKLSNDITLWAIMGSKTRDQDLYLIELHHIIEVISDMGIANIFPSSRLARMLDGTVRQAKKSRCNLDQIFEKLLQEQREKEAKGDADTLLSVLLRLHDENSENNKLSIDSIKGIILDTISGGTETSATTVDWAMAELMRSPRVMKKVQTQLREHLQGQDDITEADISKLHYMHLVIKETLRLHPPLPMLLPRECRKTCKILGYDIPKGTMVIVNAWALGRDSNCWKDAEEFKPERFEEDNSDMNFNGMDFEFIPFGAGRRICPGMTFGLAVVELILANLLYHFDWELPRGIMPHELDMTETSGMAARKKCPLFLRAIPYKY